MAVVGPTADSLCADSPARSNVDCQIYDVHLATFPERDEVYREHGVSFVVKFTYKTRTYSLLSLCHTAVCLGYPRIQFPIASFTKTTAVNDWLLPLSHG